MFLRYYYRMVTLYNITLSSAFSLLMLSVAEAARPNVVLINADDLGWAEVGCYGQKKIKTPNIDKLASEGQRWVYFYSGAPVRSPSRNGPPPRGNPPCFIKAKFVWAAVSSIRSTTPTFRKSEKLNGFLSFVF